MSKPFVLPAELDLVAEHEVLTLRYPGDAVLENDLGMESFDVEVQGDLTIRLDRVSGTIRAGGTLTVDGKIDGGSLHARVIVLGDAEARCRAIEASERIEIGAAQLTVDVIIAPTITLHPDAHGRVTVIESRNERGPTKIKGGFSLHEYEELLGNAEVFLAERGLSALREGPEIQAPAPSRRKAKGTSTPPPVEAPITLEELDEIDDIDDPLSLTTDELALVTLDDEPEASDVLHEERDALAEALQDAVGRIVRCYVDAEVPEPVLKLQAMIDERDYEALRSEITAVWSGLLGHHQRRGIRPHHQVTHAFNVIHGLLQGG